MRIVAFFLCLFPVICVAGDPPSLNYIENKGQWGEQILYRLDGGGMQMFVENDRFTFLLRHPEDQITHPLPDQPEKIRFHSYQHIFLGCNDSAEKISRQTAKTYNNYFLGSNQEKWASKVPLHKKIIFREFYNGINLKLYSTSHYTSKYDFMVAPGADPSVIKWKYRGIEEYEIKDNNLVLQTSVGEVMEYRPVAYQVIGEKKIPVECRYRRGENYLGFEIGEYDPEYELIIDPELIFSSYTGSTTDNWGNTATPGLNGEAYAAGIVYVPFFGSGDGYPTTIGAFDVDFNEGTTDIVLSKFSPDGIQLLYSTYLGGAAVEVPQSIIVNSKGELVVFGSTSSFDYPVTPNAFSTIFSFGFTYTYANSISLNGSDIIVTVLSEDGSSLIGSTYMGGSGNDGFNTEFNLKYNYGDDARGEVILDENDNIIVASSTRSSDFPVTADAYDQTFNGLQDGCIFILSPDCTALLHSTYLGGTGAECAVALTRLNNRLAVVGGTESSNFPVTSGVVGENFQGNVDGYVSVFTEDLSTLEASTYIGSSGFGNHDMVYLIDNDFEDGLYFTGHSEGNMPIIGDVYSVPNSHHFISALPLTLDSFFFSTNFGNGDGNVSLSLTAFNLDDCLKITLGGWGGKTNTNFFSTTDNFEVTDDAFQTETDGSDFYFLVLTAQAKDLLFATYFGEDNTFSFAGDHVDGGTSRFDDNGVIYHAFCASCGGLDDFPTTPGVVSAENNSTNCNMAVSKINLGIVEIESKIEAFINDPTDTANCFSNRVQFSADALAADSFYWDFGDGVTSSLQDPTHVFTDTGTYTVTLIASSDERCVIPDTATSEYTFKFRSQIRDTSLTFCRPTVIESMLQDTLADYLWQDGSTNSFYTVTEAGNYSVEAKIAFCYFEDNFEIQFPERLPLLPDTGFCEGDFITIALNPIADSVIWSTGANAIGIAIDEEGTYGVEYTIDPCRFSDTFNVVLADTLMPVFFPDTTICPGQPLIIDLTRYQGSTDIDWQDNFEGYRRTITEAGYFAFNISNSCNEIAGDFTVENLGGLNDILYIPNAFTPNQDGQNDLFKPELPADAVNIEQFKMRVFDRWGNEVFNTSDPFDGWNGIFKGDHLASGVYVWYIEMVHSYCGEPSLNKFKGDVTLIR